jgi:hypothetical protein
MPNRMGFLASFEQTDFSIWLRESDWGQPILLCFHAVGMGLVVGLSLMFSARVFGYARRFPLSAFDRLFGIAWFGFAINAASGALLFAAEPRRLLQTPAFLIKMLLIVGAGFSLWALMRTLQGGDVAAGSEAARPHKLVVTPKAKLAAIFPIVLWLGAILAGRLIGYTIGPPPL